ncbi:ABC transporter [Fusarium denticulatum]|uniref:ABC transporter n=1 Tax=Fusarium denticulatum TaxID=48507 RepID=A0A8H5XCH5_9HYPO|nr:ABC transporter [Fusarium denticulatum]
MEQDVKSSWKQLFLFTRQSHSGALIAALLAAGFSAGFKTVLSVILGKVFDIIAGFGNGSLSGDEALSQVGRWALVLVGLGVGNWVASTAFLALWVIFGELQACSVRQDIFASLLSKDMAWFDSQSEGISSLLIRIQTQTRELQLASSQVLGLLVGDIITSIASLGIALYYSWKLTLVLLATLPISAIVLSLATKQLEPAIQAQKRELAVASKFAVASITAIDLVKVFNGYDQEVWQYYPSAKAAAKHYLIQAQCNALQMGYVAFWVVAMFVVGFWYGVVLVNNDGLAAGSVLTTFYATLAAFQGIEALMPQWLVLAKGMSAGSFLSSITRNVRNGEIVKPMTGALRPLSCSGDIELKDVCFTYPSNPAQKVLHQSSFFFPSGEMTFIVGRSGSGKSTLGNLIVGFYEPLSGDVYVDNKPLRVLDRQWIRENITLVQQSSVLFNENFFKNVTFGHHDPARATRAEVMRACDAALLQSTIAGLPEGLDTNVGADGYNLSGGQKQRLALARARLRDPPVLILDEITSGLDQVSRVLIMDAIRAWRRGKTTIIITHDVAQIDADDFVYVMDNASLVQEGFRKNLDMQAGGTFATLASTASEEPDTPIDITIDSPNSPLSPLSPLFPPPGRASRLSQIVVGNLESFSPAPTSASTRLTLGTNTAAAFRMRAARAWEMQPLTVTVPEPEPVRSKSAADNHHMVSFYDEKHDNALRSHSSLDGMETSCTLVSFDEPEYVFGGAERPKSITRLRQTKFNDTLQSDRVDEKDSETKDLPPPMPLASIFKTVWPALGRGHRVLLIFGVLICLVGAGSIPAFAYCFAQLLGAMWSQGDKLAEGKMWAIYLIVIAVMDGVCTGGGRYLLEMVGQAWINTIRVEALKRILRQPRAWFDRSRNSPGRINECLDRNAEEMRNIVGRFLPIIITVTVMIITAVAWALVISWKLTLVTLAPLPVVMGAVKGYTIISGKWEARCNKGAEDASATLTEIFLNIRVVRALTLERYMGAKYMKAVRHTLSLGQKRAAHASTLYGLYQSVNYPLTALVFYYGTVLLASENAITATAVVAVVNLLLFSMGTATSILSTIPQVTMAQSTAAQMLGYANMPLIPKSEPRGYYKPKTPLPVRLDNLGFSYKLRSERPVLRGVSFEVDAGDFLAVVGRSGCGKSTVISLMLGLYSPTKTEILSTRPPLSFNGYSHAHVDMEHLRSMMAYVPQTPFLFPATIAENIVYGLSEVSHLRQFPSILAAARAAGIHEFITTLPDGYNTRVGDGGQALSGGQAQRLSIARALVRKPRLLVLDEPTSALDAESAEMIRHTMQKIAKKSRRDMAIVVVTHSKEMMAIADRIVVLEDGAKVEEGTYHELLQARGAFARVARRERNREAQNIFRRRRQAAEAAQAQRVRRLEQVVEEMSSVFMSFVDEMLTTEAVVKAQPNLVGSLRRSMERILELAHEVVGPEEDLVLMPREGEDRKRAGSGSPESEQSETTEDSSSSMAVAVRKTQVQTLTPPTSTALTSVSTPTPPSSLSTPPYFNSQQPPMAKSFNLPTFSLSPQIFGNGWLGTTPASPGDLAVPSSTQHSAFSFRLACDILTIACRLLVNSPPPYAMSACESRLFCNPLKGRAKDEMLTRLRWLIGPGRHEMYRVIDLPYGRYGQYVYSRAELNPSTVEDIEWPWPTRPAGTRIDHFTRFFSVVGVEKQLLSLGARVVDAETMELKLNNSPMPNVGHAVPKQPESWSFVNCFSFPTEPKSGPVTVRVSIPALIKSLATRSLCLMRGPGIPRSEIGSAIEEAIIKTE